MSDFNYQEYLRNNPLLKEEVKEEKLLTESQEVEELAVDRTGKDKPSGGSFRKGQYGIGDAVLDLFKKLKKENLSEDKYDDLVAGDDDIPADKKADAAKALRMLDKGASYEKVKHLLEVETVTEGNFDDLRKLKDNLDNALSAFKKKAEELKLGVSFGDATQAVNKYIDDVFKADSERTGGKIDESAEVTEEANYSNKDGYMAFADNENIVGTYGVDDAIEFARELAMTHFDAGAQQDKFVDDFMIAYKEAGYDKGEEIQEEVPSSKMKVSELKAKIKEDILSILSEQDEEEDVEVDVEDEIEVDTEEPALDAVGGGDEGLSADEKEIQDSLKIAYDNAVAIGDTKLADQIGNSITFFTRTHVVER